MKMADSNPRFMWLLRDVILIPTDKNGKPCHIKDHLLQKVNYHVNSVVKVKVYKSSHVHSIIQVPHHRLEQILCIVL